MNEMNHTFDRHLVGSVGWVPDCRAGGRGFQHSNTQGLKKLTEEKVLPFL